MESVPPFCSLGLIGIAHAVKLKKISSIMHNPERSWTETKAARWTVFAELLQETYRDHNLQTPNRIAMDGKQETVVGSIAFGKEIAGPSTSTQCHI